MENIRQKVAEIITHTHKTPLEQADEILLLFGVIKSACDHKGQIDGNVIRCTKCNMALCLYEQTVL